MKMVGYLSATKEGIIGESGVFYNYILGAGGLYVRAENPLIRATICIAPAEVRGLVPVEEKIDLVHGKIPRRLYELVLSVLIAEAREERYLAITWNNGYHIACPPQIGTVASVEYEPLQGTVLDIHSHGGMPAFFSGTDNRDDQGMRFSMVLGKLAEAPEYLMRLTVYGYYADIDFDEVFL